MCCGCCCCCKQRGKVHGYVGPPGNQPVTVTAVLTQPPPIVIQPAPTVSHLAVPMNHSGYPTAGYTTTMPQPSREVPPPYSEIDAHAPHAPAMLYSSHEYPKQNTYNPNV